MIALFSSEMLRMRSRRLIRILLIVGIGGVLVTTVIRTLTSHRPTAEDRAQAHAMYEENLLSCVNDIDSQVPPSERQGLTPEQWCVQNWGLPSEEAFLNVHEYDIVSLPDSLLGTAFLFIVMSMTIGASSIGAEWGYGTVTTLLAWEPRRSRVLVIRLLAVAVTVAVIVLLLQALLTFGLYGAASLRGSTAGATSTWLHTVLSTMGRITLIAVLTSSIGLAVATIGRSTAAALGVLVGYLALFESLLRGLRPSMTPWLLASSVVTYLTGHRTEVYLPPDGHVLYVSVAHSLVVTCVYSAALFLIALASFRSRDVT